MKEVFGDAGDQGAEKHQHSTALIEPLEPLKARIRVKLEHLFRLVKRQFGFTKAHYRDLAKNTEALMTSFALSNLWMARRRLLAMTPEVCP